MLCTCVCSGDTVNIECDADKYLPELTEFGGFNFFVMGRVSDTKQVFSKQFDTVLDKPEITITVSIVMLNLLSNSWLVQAIKFIIFVVLM